MSEGAKELTFNHSARCDLYITLIEVEGQPERGLALGFLREFGLASENKVRL